ncbi:MAG: WD40/YVTN/BNR-like repeat-containing protein, partial [Acidimicrobiales bacterium]
MGLSRFRVALAVVVSVIGVTAVISSFSTLSSLPALAATSTRSVGVAVGAPGGSAQGWTVSASYPGFSLIDGLACPSAQVCYAALNDSAIYRSSNGGVSWVNLTLPLEMNVGFVSGENAISCPTAQDCYVASNEDVFATSDGGVSWKMESVSTNGSLLGISCPSYSTCYVVGQTGLTSTFVARTSDSGATWTVTTLPSSVWVTNIVCPSISECFGSYINSSVVVSTADGGATWNVESLPSGVSGLYQMSCPTPTQCVAVGVESDASGTPISVATSDSGAVWTMHAVPGNATPESIACPSSSICYAVGSGTPLASSDMGQSWSALAPPPKPSLFLSIACTSTTSCVAGGGELISSSSGGVQIPAPAFAISTSDAGASWKQLNLPTSTTPQLAVSCPSPLVCYADGLDSILSTKNGGISWAVDTLPGADFLGFASAISCPSIEVCYVAGPPPIWASGPGNLEMIMTTNGGATWRPVVLPPVPGYLSPGVSCPSTQECFVVEGGEVIETTDGAASWTVDTALSGKIQLNSVACPSIAVCFAAGSVETTGSGVISNPVVVRTEDGGATWSVLNTPVTAKNSSLMSISCPTPSTCYAVGASAMGNVSGGFVIETSDSGATWKIDSVPTNVLGLIGVSCPSTASCTAVGGYSAGSSFTPIALSTSDSGGSWIAQPLPASTRNTYSVSCPTTSGCFVAGVNFEHGGLVLGSAVPSNPNCWGVGAAPFVAPTGGYWLAGGRGAVFSCGQVGFYGSLSSMGAKPLNAAIVGIAGTPDGKGYWEVASDGGIFSFGDATFYGSMGAKPLNAAIVGIAGTPDGKGYWEVASDGGIFSFGDATFYG